MSPRRAFCAFPRYASIMAAVWRRVRILRLFVARVFGRGQWLLRLGSGESFEDHFEVRGQGVVMVIFFILGAVFLCRLRLLLRFCFLRRLWGGIRMGDNYSWDRRGTKRRSAGFGIWRWCDGVFGSFCLRAGALRREPKQSWMRQLTGYIGS